MSLWSHISGAASAVKDHVVDPTVDAVTGAAGELTNAENFLVGRDANSSHALDHAPLSTGGDQDWNFQDQSGAQKQVLGKTLTTGLNLPGIKQGLEGLNWATNQATNFEVYGDLNAHSSLKQFLTGSKYSWADANRLRQQRGVNFGQGFMLQFEDQNGEVLNNQQRYADMKANSTIFNAGALAFNAVAAWKSDPGVILGKTAGAVNDIRVGAIAKDGRAATIQRDVLGAADRTEAVKKAKAYSNPVDKVHAQGALNLQKNIQNLRTTALGTTKDDFAQMPVFRGSTNGMKMASLMHDAAKSDNQWNTVLRVALGDDTAVDELRQMDGKYSDLIDQINQNTHPKLQDEIERVNTLYDTRVAALKAQGASEDQAHSMAGSILIGPNDKSLTATKAELDAEHDALLSQLQTYKEHQDWIDYVVPSLHGTSNAADSIFNGLRTTGSAFQRGRAIASTARTDAWENANASSITARGGKVWQFQAGSASPRHTIVNWGQRQALKRIGVVNLNNAAEGGEAMHHSINMLEDALGTKNPVARSRIMSDWMSATNDVQRKAVVDKFQHEAFEAIGSKYGLDTDMMRQLGKIVAKNRQDNWAKLGSSEGRRAYSNVKGLDKTVGYTDEAGHPVNVAMPIDPTQLQDWHPLINWLDMDRTVKENKSLLEGHSRNWAYDKAMSTKGHVEDLYETVGHTFNKWWKPAQLLSIRWPARVVADESLRILLAAGIQPQLEGAIEGSANAFNNGLVRATEFFRGRKFKTGIDDSNKVPTVDFDHLDDTAGINPNAVIPADSWDLNKVDDKLYDKINFAVDERRRHISSAGVLKPKSGRTWNNLWDQHIAEGDGFLIDPMNLGKRNTASGAIRDGHAITPYPSRLRSFDHAPSAAEMNEFVGANSDLLAIPGNQLAVFKKDGHWVMDVAKHRVDSDSAAVAMQHFNAPGMYDIADGFEHYENPNYADALYGKDAEPASDGHVVDDIEPEIKSGKKAKKQVGFGQITLKTKSGKIKIANVYGDSTADPNMFLGANSSRSAFDAMFRGHAHGLTKGRINASERDVTHVAPVDADGDINPQWSQAYAYYVNHHVRMSPIGRRMLVGQGDDKIIQWLDGTPEGRRVADRMGVTNTSDWITNVARPNFDHVFTTDAAREAAVAGKLDAKQVEKLIPKEARNDILGDSLMTGMGAGTQGVILGLVKRGLDAAMNKLATGPTDRLVRHPFAASVYKREMRAWAKSLPADTMVSQDAVNAAEASARAEATRQVRKYLYNMADERQVAHTLRFISPFFQAQLEVLEKYAGLAMEKPETVARMATLFKKSQTYDYGNLMTVVDQNGQPAKGYSDNNQVVVQGAMYNALKFLANTVGNNPIPFLNVKGSLDSGKGLGIPVSSINVVTAGGNPFIPSLGPIATLPMAQWYNRHPSDYDSWIGKVVFPYGGPGYNATDQVSSLAPAWFKRFLVERSSDMTDSAFARTVAQRTLQLQNEWAANGKKGPQPTDADGLKMAKAEYRLRAFSSFFSPVPVVPQGGYEPMIQAYHMYQQKYGLDAGDRFYADFGPDNMLLALRATESQGMNPTDQAFDLYDKNKKLIQQAPSMLSVLTQPDGTVDTGFSEPVYEWQLSSKVNPTDGSTIRTRLSAADQERDSYIQRGWIQYNQLQEAVNAKLRERAANGGDKTLTANSNNDIQAYRAQALQKIYNDNPGFQDAFGSQNKTMDAFLSDAYKVAFDPSLNDRSDIKGLRTYLYGRAYVNALLDQRQAAGGSHTLSIDPATGAASTGSGNYDIAVQWQNFVSQLTASNPGFASIYNRYLSSDDLSTQVDVNPSSLKVAK